MSGTGSTPIERYDPRKKGALCDKCPRRGSTPVPPDGPKGASWCWLGQDPGDVEVRQGKGFVGPTGARLLKLWTRACEELSRPVVPRSQIWVTNAALCAPITDSEAEARQAMTCCRPRLARELRRLSPHAWILTMGKWALHGLTGQEKGMGKIQGFHIEIDVEKIKAEADERAAMAKVAKAINDIPF